MPSMKPSLLLLALNAAASAAEYNENNNFLQLQSHLSPTVEHILEDLHEYSKLFISTTKNNNDQGNCVWSECGLDDQTDDQYMGDNRDGDEKWYKYRTQSFCANAAYTLYGIKKDSSSSFLSGKCTKAHFINSFFTYGGADTLLRKLGVEPVVYYDGYQYDGQQNKNLRQRQLQHNEADGQRELYYDDDGYYSTNADCVQIDYQEDDDSLSTFYQLDSANDRRLNSKDNQDQNDYYSSALGCNADNQFAIAAFRGNDCDGNNFIKSIAYFDDYNKQHSDIKCRSIWTDDSPSNETIVVNNADFATVYHLLRNSWACDPRLYPNECPDPYHLKDRFEYALATASRGGNGVRAYHNEEIRRPLLIMAYVLFGLMWVVLLTAYYVGSKRRINKYGGSDKNVVVGFGRVVIEDIGDLCWKLWLAIVMAFTCDKSKGKGDDDTEFVGPDGSDEYSVNSEGSRHVKKDAQVELVQTPTTPTAQQWPVQGVRSLSKSPKSPRRTKRNNGIGGLKKSPIGRKKDRSKRYSGANKFHAVEKVDGIFQSVSQPGLHVDTTDDMALRAVMSGPPHQGREGEVKIDYTVQRASKPSSPVGKSDVPKSISVSPRRSVDVGAEKTSVGQPGSPGTRISIGGSTQEIFHALDMKKEGGEDESKVESGVKTDSFNVAEECGGVVKSASRSISPFKRSKEGRDVSASIGGSASESFNVAEESGDIVKSVSRSISPFKRSKEGASEGLYVMEDGGGNVKSSGRSISPFKRAGKNNDVPMSISVDPPLDSFHQAKKNSKVQCVSQPCSPVNRGHLENLGAAKTFDGTVQSSVTQPASPVKSAGKYGAVSMSIAGESALESFHSAKRGDGTAQGGGSQPSSPVKRSESGRGTRISITDDPVLENLHAAKTFDGKIQRGSQPGSPLGNAVEDMAVPMSISEPAQPVESKKTGSDRTSWNLDKDEF